MNWVAAVTTGFGLGLASFGGLWLNVRGIQPASGSPVRLRIGRSVRLGLAGLTFYALLTTGGFVALLAGLIGWQAARWHLVRAIGGSADDR